MKNLCKEIILPIKTLHSLREILDSFITSAILSNITSYKCSYGYIRYNEANKIFNIIKLNNISIIYNKKYIRLDINNDLSSSEYILLEFDNKKDKLKAKNELINYAINYYCLVDNNLNNNLLVLYYNNSFGYIKELEGKFKKEGDKIV